MRYVFLIYDDEKKQAAVTEQEIGPIMEAWTRYTEDLRKAGKMQAGEALQPTTNATTVRLQGSKTLTSDGPFAETKEQLGGFYVVDARDLDEAIEWAARMPNLPTGGSVEVRPLMEFEVLQQR